jgi:hypothetical protein
MVPHSLVQIRIHLRNLNFRHFRMVKATELKIRQLDLPLAQSDITPLAIDGIHDCFADSLYLWGHTLSHFYVCRCAHMNEYRLRFS